MTNLPAVRERTEELERASLSTWATLAVETKGRDLHEEPDPLRTSFQLDRDRIIQSTAFRRLKHKTHLLLGDGHRRMRMTHALEVAQIARTIGRGLRLNEDLIEAVALGHDVGHTAFGESGEAALSAVAPVPFLHEEQSLRVVERLEDQGRGLNLTWEVRDGILNHARGQTPPATLEGQAVRWADRIAAATLDLQQLCRLGLCSDSDVPAASVAALGESHDTRLSALISDVITTSTDQPELSMSKRSEEAMDAVDAVGRRALTEAPSAAAERNRAMHCLSSLAVYWFQHADRLPGDVDTVAAVWDTVSAYTDTQALDEFTRRFLPSG